MAEVMTPVAARKVGPTWGPASAGSAHSKAREQTQTKSTGVLPNNPWAIPSEYDENGDPSRGLSGSSCLSSSRPAWNTSLGPARMPSRNAFASSCLPLLRKLAIGSTTDPLEAEADAAAQSVAGREGNRSIPRPRSLGTPPLTDAPPIVHQVLRSPGDSLDHETRGWAEPAFQSDFSQVRIHAGEQAAASASSINARAYTVGSDIVLGPGVPVSGPEHRRLVAHELAHVVQQGMAPQRSPAGLSPEQPSSAQHESGVRSAQPMARPQLLQRTSTLVQREEDPAPADLGWLSEGLVSVLSAPAMALGDTAYGLVRSTFHGFVAEIKSGASDAAHKVMGRLKEFATSPSELLSFFPKYWWGLLKGVFSPITGLFDLVMFGVNLESMAEQVLVTAWERREQLASDAKGLAATMRSMGGKAKTALGGMLSHPIDTISALGPLLSKAQKDANAAAEKGGHKIGGMLLEAADKPIPDLAETAGEVIGTVVVNVVLFIFTDGIGDAIVQVSTKLGEFASALSKLGKTAEMLGGVVAKLAELLTGIGGWVTKAEEFISSIASTVLKPLEPVLKEFGEAMTGLRTFLRDLLGVAEKAEGQEAAALAKGLSGATREGTPPKLPSTAESHPAPHATATHAQPEPHAPVSAATKETPHPAHVETHQPAKVPAAKEPAGTSSAQSTPAPTKPPAEPPTTTPGSRSGGQPPQPRRTAHAGGEGEDFKYEYRRESVPEEVRHGRTSGHAEASSTDEFADEMASKAPTKKPSKPPKKKPPERDPEPGKGARDRASKEGIRKRKKMGAERLTKEEYDPMRDVLERDQLEEFIDRGGKVLPKEKQIEMHHTRQSSAHPHEAGEPEHIQPVTRREHRGTEHSRNPKDVPTAGIAGDVTSPEHPIYDPNDPDVLRKRANPSEPIREPEFEDVGKSVTELGKRRPPGFRDIPKVKDPKLRKTYDYQLKTKGGVYLREIKTEKWIFVPENGPGGASLIEAHPGTKLPSRTSPTEAHKPELPKRTSPMGEHQTPGMGTKSRPDSHPAELEGGGPIEGFNKLMTYLWLKDMLEIILGSGTFQQKAVAVGKNVAIGTLSGAALETLAGSELAGPVGFLLTLTDNEKFIREQEINELIDDQTDDLMETISHWRDSHPPPAENPWGVHGRAEARQHIIDKLVAEQEQKLNEAKGKAPEKFLSVMRGVKWQATRR